MSETERYRHLTKQFCNGNGVDIGSGGDPVVPWAISVDLPADEFARYNSGHSPANSIHWSGDAKSLPFKDGTLDFVYSSHLLEDFADWNPLLIEWKRVLKRGGKLVILIPDKQLFNEAIQRGQPPNCAHQHEGRVGEITEHFRRIGGVHSLNDALTNQFEGDYSILYVGEKQ